MNDFWQENKRFLTLAGSGLLVFFIGWLIVSGLYLGDVRQKQAAARSIRQKLGDGRYSVADRDLAEAENAALVDSLQALAEIAEFRPRPEFVLPPGGHAAASKHYGAAVERVREQLFTLAGRKRISLPQGLDLDLVMTNSAEVYERHLHALDLLDRALQLAIQHNVKSIKRIRIDLDPKFRSRRGVDPIEETVVEIEASATPAAVTAWLQSTQTREFGQVLPLRSLEARVRRAKVDELTAKVAFSVIRLHLPPELGGDEATGEAID